MAQGNDQMDIRIPGVRLRGQTNALELAIGLASAEMGRQEWQAAAEQLCAAQHACGDRVFPLDARRMLALCYAEMSRHLDYFSCLGFLGGKVRVGPRVDDRKSIRRAFADFDRFGTDSDRCSFLIKKSRPFRRVRLDNGTCVFEKTNTRKYSAKIIRFDDLYGRKLSGFSLGVVAYIRGQRGLDALYFDNIETIPNAADAVGDWLIMEQLLAGIAELNSVEDMPDQPGPPALEEIVPNYFRRLTSLADNATRWCELAYQVDDEYKFDLSSLVEEITEFMNGLKWVVSHGDVHFGNMGFRNGTLTMIDWDSWGRAPIGSDVSRILFNHDILFSDALEKYIRYYSERLSGEWNYADIRRSVILNIVVIHLYEIVKSSFNPSRIRLMARFLRSLDKLR